MLKIECPSGHDHTQDFLTATYSALAEEGFSRDQIDRALELIEVEGAVVPSDHRDGAYIVQGRNGRYFADGNVCTCDAIQFDKQCYHNAAARIWDTLAFIQQEWATAASAEQEALARLLSSLNLS